MLETGAAGFRRSLGAGCAGRVVRGRGEVEVVVFEAGSWKSRARRMAGAARAGARLAQGSAAAVTRLLRASDSWSGSRKLV